VNAEMQQQRPAANAPLSVTMPLQTWRVLLDVLANGPFRTVQPLISEIERQCNAQLPERADAG
jgi:hypothetical protein